MLDYDPAVRTRILARIVGPYLVIMAIALLVRLATLPLLFPAFMQDGPLVLLSGAFALIVGLTMLVAHHHWSSWAAIAITLIGFAAAIKGALLMIAPDLGSEVTAAVVRTPPVMLVAAALELVLGIWLSFVGWFSKA